MKPKDRLAIIRDKRSTFAKRFMAVADRIPGTKFDREITLARMYPLKPDDPCFDEFAAFEQRLFTAIKDGDSKLFRQLARAIDSWHSHKPFMALKDRVRKAVLWYSAGITGQTNRDIKVREIVKATGASERLVRIVCDELKVKRDSAPGKPRK